MQDWDSYYMRYVREALHAYLTGFAIRHKLDNHHLWNSVWGYVAAGVEHDPVGFFQPRKLRARQRMLRAIGEHLDRRHVRFVERPLQNGVALDLTTPVSKPTLNDEANHPYG